MKQGGIAGEGENGVIVSGRKRSLELQEDWGVQPPSKKICFGQKEYMCNEIPLMEDTRLHLYRHQ